MEAEICERDRTINQTMTTGLLGDGEPAGNVAAGVILLKGLCNTVMFHIKKMLIFQLPISKLI